MLDRGLHRNYGRSAEAEAVAATDEPFAADAQGGPHRPAHVHDRPRRRQGLRRRDLGHARERPRAPLGPHRRRDRLPASRRAAGARGHPPRHERVRARGGGADAPGGALEPRLLAASGRGEAGRDGRARDGGRGGPQGRLPPLARAQRRPAHLRPGGRGVRRARARRGALGRAAGGGARGGARSPRAPRLAGHRRPRAGVRVRRARATWSACATRSRPSRTA